MPRGARHNDHPESETGRFATPYKETAYLKRKAFIAKIKTDAGCADCNIMGPAEILSFDHVRGEKCFAIGSRWDVSMSRLLAEIAKCEVVCLNHHALRTIKRNEERRDQQGQEDPAAGVHPLP